MLVKKRLLISSSIILVVILFFSACTQNNITENSEVHLFRQKEAMDVAKKYLELVSQGDLEGATKLYAEDLSNKNESIDLGKSKISSLAPQELIEAGEWDYAIFSVIRRPDTGIQCDLDNVKIKVIKEKEQYKIAEVQSANKQHIFEKNNQLRIIGEDGSKSDLIVDINSIAKEVYLKEGDVTLKKESMVNKEFGPIALSYTGERVAITTLGENKTFICVASIEKAKKTQGSMDGKSSNEAASEQDLQGMLEKPIAQKIIPIDILINSKIENILFSELEEEVIVQYTEESGVERLNIYKESNGEILPLKLDTIFPKEKYNIKFKSLDKKMVFVEVYGRNGANDIHSELIGNYKIDMNKLEVSKI